MLHMIYGNQMNETWMKIFFMIIYYTYIYCDVLNMYRVQM